MRKMTQTVSEETTSAPLLAIKWYEDLTDICTTEWDDGRYMVIGNLMGITSVSSKLQNFGKHLILQSRSIYYLHIYDSSLTFSVLHIIPIPNSVV